MYQKIIACGLLLSSSLLGCGTTPPPTNTETSAAAGLIVKYKISDTNVLATGAAGLDALADSLSSNEEGVSFAHQFIRNNNSQVLKATGTFATTQLESIAQKLTQESNIESAEVNYSASALYIPDDTLFDSQWNLDSAPGIDLGPALDSSTGAGVVIAVIDTGFVNHQDMPNMLPGYDFISDPTSARDGDGRDANPIDEGTWCGSSNSLWHGTRVASTMVSSTDNNLGIAGVSPFAQVVPIRVLGRCGSGTLADIADAIRWAAGLAVVSVPINDNPADIINLSLGGTSSCNITLQNAINEASQAGSLIVVAAGNNGADAANTTPANCNNVITVGATDEGGNRWDDSRGASNWGSTVKISAPGASIPTAANAGTTVEILGADVHNNVSGTSLSAPHVAGVSALMLSANPHLSSTQLFLGLLGTSESFTDNCQICGYGIVNASDAVGWAIDMLQNTYRLEPTERFPSPNNRYSLVYQQDGNLAIYRKDNSVVWNTGTFSNPGFLAMQGDGNLVIYDDNNNAVWNSGTAGNPGAIYKMQDDGNLVIYYGLTALWDSQTFETGYLLPGEVMNSPSGEFYLVYQTDGNLVLYQTDGSALWQSSTAGSSPGRLVIQRDGNLVLTDASNTLLWNSESSGSYSGVELSVTDDGNVTLSSNENSNIWSAL